MPRFGKSYKMYKRIVPSLYLDITDILEYGELNIKYIGVFSTSINKPSSVPKTLIKDIIIMIVVLVVQ